MSVCVCVCVIYLVSHVCKPSLYEGLYQQSVNTTFCETSGLLNRFVQEYTLNVLNLKLSYIICMKTHL